MGSQDVKGEARQGPPTRTAGCAGFALFALLAGVAPPVVLAQAGPAAAGTSAPGAEAPARPGTAREPRFTIRRYVVEGAKLLQAEVLQDLLEPLTGPGKRFSDIEAALDAVIAAYLRSGITAVQVVIPEQTLQDGEVRLKVEELQVARVDVQGARSRRNDNLRRAVPSLQEGRTPVDTVLAGELRLANGNPGRRMELTFRPEEDGTLTGVLRVADREPLAGQLSLDNSGSRSTGRWRMGLAVQHANLLDRDIVGTVQWQTSPGHERQVRVGALGLGVPWYAAGLMLDASASASNIDSGLVRTLAGDYRMSTQGRSAGLRATRLLPRLGGTDPSVSLGIDWKHVVPRVGSSASGPSLVPDILLRPLTLSYSLRGEDAGTRFAGQVGVSRNFPGRGRSAPPVFAEPGLRVGATPEYLLWRADLQLQRTFGANQWVLGWNGQWTRSTLVPAEQFSAGGVGSVRGFEGRLATGDVGHRGSIELQGPLPNALQPASVRLGWQVYADVARLRRHQVQTGESTRTGLASAGVGLRLDGPGAFTLRGDAAVVTEGSGVAAPGTVYVHVAAYHGF